MLVGCFPEHMAGYHEFAAIMAFGGFSVSAFFLLIDLIYKKKWSTVLSIYVIYIILLIVMFVVPVAYRNAILSPFVRVDNSGMVIVIPPVR